MDITEILIYIYNIRHRRHNCQYKIFAGEKKVNSQELPHCSVIISTHINCTDKAKYQIYYH